MEGADFLFEEYGIDHLLSSFSDGALPPLPIMDSDSPVSVSSDPVPVPEPDLVAASMDELERFLMSDEEETHEAAEGIEGSFFDGLFVHELLTESDGSNHVRSDGLVENDQEKERDPSDDSVEKYQEKERDSGDDSVEKGQEKERDSDDDPVAKKIRRKMRNRDSARSSRERKKEYIKELENKSRFLESECKRLNYSLQCFMAENMALRQTLHSKEIAAGKDKKSQRADVAMRESAELFLESRQLGSLHLLVSIVWCLLLSLLTPHQAPPRTPTSPRRGLAPVPNLVAAPKNPKGEIDLRYKSEQFFLLWWRCKYFRSGMKLVSCAFTGLEIVC